MPAIHVRDVPETTLTALRRRAARRGHSVQQEVREVLAKAAAEPISGARPRRLELRTVATGHTKAFNRGDFYGNDER